MVMVQVLCSVPFAGAAGAEHGWGARPVHGGAQYLHRRAPDDHRRRIRAVGRAVRQGQHPAFAAASVFAFTAAIAGILMLPK
jgi:hypothetical protein